jgi:hypothetical protein
VAALERRFIGVGHAWAQVTRNTDTTITAGASYSVAWESFLTNAPLSFWTNTDGSMTQNNTSGDTRLVCAQYGVYPMLAMSEWEHLAAGYPHYQVLTAGRQRGLVTSGFGNSIIDTGQAPYTPASGAVTLDLADVGLGIHEWWDYTPTQPANWTMQAVNQDTVSRQLLRASLVVVLLPNGQRELDFTVY